MKPGAAGYSGTPLPQKLGIKPGTRIVVLGAPWDYARVVAPPEGVTLTTRLPKRAGFIHWFVARRAELDRRLSTLAGALDDSGMLWVSWPKKSAGVPTDVSEDLVRGGAIALGLVDVKVCAVDAVWSGLKLVRRVEERGGGR
jgi:hypothetical protein